MENRKVAVATSVVGWMLLGAAFVSTGCTETPPQSSSLEPAKQQPAPALCPSDMILIPAGTFRMGSDDGAEDQKPVHEVTLAGFCIDRTEVTVAAYAECVREGTCPPAPTTADWPGIREEDKAIDSLFCNGTREDRQEHPINCVSRTLAETFCRAMDKRLPTEEEWEYAARGDDGRMFPWGNAAPAANLLNSLGDETAAMGARLGHPGWKTMFDGNDGWESTAAVGSYPAGASPFGVLDMAGNVWEFTSSGYSEDYHTEPGGQRFVYRGGGWGADNISFIRTTYRGKGVREYRGADLGFRCASSVK